MIYKSIHSMFICQLPILRFMKELFSTNKINIIFISLAIIHFILAFVTTEISHTVKFYFSEVVVLISLVVFWQSIPYFYKKVKENNQDIILFLKHFSFYFTIQCFFLILLWPGVYRGAEMFYIYQDVVESGSFFYWYHWLLSFFWMCCINIFNHVAGVAFVQVLLISVIVAYSITKISKLFPSKFNYILYLPFLFPFIISYNLYPDRLNLYTYLCLYLSVTLIYMYTTKEKAKTSEVFLIALTGAIAATLRSENLTFLFIIPLIIVFLKVFNKKQLVYFSIVFTFLSFGILSIQSKGVQYEYHQHQIGQIVHLYYKDKLYSNNPTLDNHNLSLSFDTEKMHYDNWEDLPSIKPIKSRKDFAKVNLTTIKILVLNYPYYLKNNLKSFTDVYYRVSIYPGLKINIFVFDDLQKEMDYYKKLSKSSVDFLYSRASTLNNDLYTKTLNLLDYGHFNTSDFEEPTSLFKVLYNKSLVLVILLSLLIFGLIKRYKIFIAFPSLWLASAAILIPVTHWPWFIYTMPIFVNGYFLGVVFLCKFIYEKNRNLKEN